MKMRSIFAVGLALAMATPAMSATNLLINGSFENGFNGWTVTQNGGGTAPVTFAYGSTDQHPTGAFGEAILPNTVTSLSSDLVLDNLAYFSSDTANPHAISQAITLVAGQTYNIGFDYYAPQNGINNPQDAVLSFALAGNPVGGSVIAGQLQTPPKTWINFNTTFVAAGSGVFEFQFRGLGSTAADFAIDRVYVQAVPEPATWMMMIFGFGLLGHAMRRRTRLGHRQSFA